MAHLNPKAETYGSWNWLLDFFKVMETKVKKTGCFEKITAEYLRHLYVDWNAKAHTSCFWSQLYDYFWNLTEFWDFISEQMWEKWIL